MNFFKKVLLRSKALKKLNFLLFLIIFILPIFLILFNVRSVVFSQNIYQDEFTKYGIYSRFDNLDNVISNLLEYLHNGEGEINNSFFNNREKIHLEEVKDLLGVLFVIQNALLGLLVVGVLLFMYLVRKKYLEYIFLILFFSGLFGVVLIVLFILMAVFFNSSFILFHELVFPTDTWMLDPATSNLINMFPQNIFFDMFLIIVLRSFGCFAGLLIVDGRGLGFLRCKRII